MSVIISAVINFIIMVVAVYFILKFLFLRDKKVGQVLRERREQIEKSIADSEEAIKVAEKALSEAEQQLHDSMEEVKRIMDFTEQKQKLLEQKTHEYLAQMREQLMKEVEAEVERLVNKTTNEVLASFSNELVERVVAELSKKLDAEHQRRIIEKGMEQI